MQENIHRLKVPRRPTWTKEMTGEDLDAQEREYFLGWRRDLAECVLARPLTPQTPLPECNDRGPQSPFSSPSNRRTRVLLPSPERPHGYPLRRLEETDTVTVTPFEKNLQVWRQLWRVLERSDLVRQASPRPRPLPPLRATAARTEQARPRPRGPAFGASAAVSTQVS